MRMKDNEEEMKKCCEKKEGEWRGGEGGDEGE